MLNECVAACADQDNHCHRNRTRQRAHSPPSMSNSLLTEGLAYSFDQRLGILIKIK